MSLTASYDGNSVVLNWNYDITASEDDLADELCPAPYARGRLYRRQKGQGSWTWLYTTAQKTGLGTSDSGTYKDNSADPRFDYDYKFEVSTTLYIVTSNVNPGRGFDGSFDQDPNPFCEPKTVIQDVWSLVFTFNYPSPFSFTTVHDVITDSYVFSEEITIRVPRVLPVSVFGGQLQINNNGVWLAGSHVNTIQDGDRIKLRSYAPSTFETTKDVQITIGGTTEIWKYKTTYNPETTLLILDEQNLSDPKKVSFADDIISFFGGRRADKPSVNVSLTSYVRGGAYIPDIPYNRAEGVQSKAQAVPSSAPISLVDLKGAATIFKIGKVLNFKSAYVDSSLKPVLHTTRWTIPDDFRLLYGSTDAAEFAWEVSIDQGGILAGQPYLLVTASDVFSQNNRSCLIQMKAERDEQADFSARVTVRARSIYDRSKLVQSTAQYMGFVLSFGDH